MSYLEYVVAAYAVFAAVLAWDFIAPRVRIAQTLRAARLLANAHDPLRQVGRIHMHADRARRIRRIGGWGHRLRVQRRRYRQQEGE